MEVSIIIPIYNVEPYILQCLESVAAQTFTNGVECILVDDRGNDKSINHAEEFVNNYSGDIIFQIIHHETNLGLSAARNTGLNIAKGMYIYFLDSDDKITPDCIEIMYSLAQKYNADMVQGSYISKSILLNDFANKLPEYLNDCGTIKKLMLNYDVFPVMAQNRLIKKDVIIDNGIWFKEGIIHEDNHWTFFLAKHINTLAISNSHTYYYQITANSITSVKNHEKETRSYSAIIKDFCNNIDSFERGAQKCLILFTLLIIKNKQYYNSKEEFKQTIKSFSKHNNFIEKILLKFVFNTYSNNWIHKKTVNFIQRIYNL